MSGTFNSLSTTKINLPQPGVTAGKFDIYFIYVFTDGVTPHHTHHIIILKSKSKPDENSIVNVTPPL